MEEGMKEVLFSEYCGKCKHSDLSEYEDPCDSCLSVPAREYSHKPMMFEEKKGKYYE